MAERALFDIITNIRTDLIALVFYGFITYYLIEMARGFIANRIEVQKFKQNPYVSLGRIVKINGFTGRIKEIKSDEIFLEGEEGYLVIPSARWSYYTWVFLRTETKDGNSEQVSGKNKK